MDVKCITLTVMQAEHAELQICMYMCVYMYVCLKRIKQLKILV